jgi:hypothetical protein
VDHGHFAALLKNPFPDDGSSSHGGRVTDLGAAWVYFPDARLRGLMLEAGFLLRIRDVTVSDYDLGSSSGPRTTDTHSKAYAGRALLGWMQPLGRTFFVAFAGGVSVGGEIGEAHSVIDDGREMPTTSIARVARRDVTGEAYLRFGFRFGAASPTRPVASPIRSSAR